MSVKLSCDLYFGQCISDVIDEQVLVAGVAIGACSIEVPGRISNIAGVLLTNMFSLLSDLFEGTASYTLDELFTLFPLYGTSGEDLLYNSCIGELFVVFDVLGSNPEEEFFRELALLFLSVGGFKIEDDFNTDLENELCFNIVDDCEGLLGLIINDFDWSTFTVDPND